MLRPHQAKKDSVALGAKTSVGVHFCIVRARRRKNLVRASFLHRSRQSQKHSVAPGAKKLRSAFIFTSFAPVGKFFGRARCENNSVCVHFCIIRARHKKNSVNDHMYFARTSPKKLRLAVLVRSRQSQKLLVAPGTEEIGRRSYGICSRQSKKLKSAGLITSVAPVAKFFGCASRENTSVRVHSCWSHLSCKKNCGRLSLVLRSRQSQMSAETFASVTPVEKLSVAPDAKTLWSAVARASVTSVAKKKCGHRTILFWSRQS